MTKMGQGWTLGAAALLLLVGSGIARAQGAAPRATDTDAVQARDAWLEKQVESKFEKDATLRAQGLDVTVIAGKVTLTGTTGSEKEKAFAQKVATSIKGVSDVDNQILVRGSKEAAKPAGDPARRKAPARTDDKASDRRPATTEPTERDRAEPPRDPERTPPPRPGEDPALPDPRAPDTDIAPVIPEARSPVEPRRTPEAGEEGKTGPGTPTGPKGVPVP
jgi:hypothetical protein